jgi:hypothetical protein
MMQDSQKPSASKLRIYNLFPLYHGPVSAWINEIPRARSMDSKYLYVNPFHETGGMPGVVAESWHHDGEKGVLNKYGCLYAIRDHFSLDHRFKEHPDTTKQEDFAQLKKFTDECKKVGLRPMMDMVTNHVALDHPWTEEHKELFVLDPHGRPACPQESPESDPWQDVAQLNYADPQSRVQLITLWRGYIDFWVGQIGFQGVRCDVAKMVPPAVWREIISYAKEKYPNVIFIAEALNCPVNVIKGLYTAGFDCVYDSLKWRDCGNNWYADHRRGLDGVKVVNFAENHDTDRLAYTVMQDLVKTGNYIQGEPVSPLIQQLIRQTYEREIALSALVSHGILLFDGTEFMINQPRPCPFSTTPRDWTEAKKHSLGNITEFIRDVNTAFRTANGTLVPQTEGQLADVLRIAGTKKPVIEMLRKPGGFREISPSELAANQRGIA